jgi:hypothetical protein
VNDDEMEAQMEYWKQRAEAAEAEVQRLKEALVRIRDGACSNPYHEIANVAHRAGS